MPVIFVSLNYVAPSILFLIQKYSDGESLRCLLNWVPELD